MYSSSTRTLFWLTIIFTVIAIISGPLWVYWFILPLTFFMWMLIDMMFMQTNMFVYEPDYNNWKEYVEEEY